MNMRVTTFAPARSAKVADLPEKREAEGDKRVEDWVDDRLTPEAFISPIQGLVGKDSELFVDLVATYRGTDNAEFEQAAGALARRLIDLIKQES